MNPHPVLYLPLSFQGDKAFVDVGGNIGMNVQIELLYSDLVHQPVDLPFQLVGEENARADLARAETGGARPLLGAHAAG